MRSIVLAISALLLVTCGDAGPQIVVAPAAPEAPPAADDDPAFLVQVAATTDKTEYAVGEPILVRRVFENAGAAPAGAHPYAYGHDNLLVVGVTTSSSSGLYDAMWVEPPDRHIREGERTVGVMRVELPGPGPYTIEVPPKYVSRSGFGASLGLDVTVVDRDDPRHVDAKAERLGRLIAAETVSTPMIWTEAQSDVQTLGEAAVPHLRRWLREAESAHLRAVSAKLLFHVKGRAGIPDLVASLCDESAKVRVRCLDTLGAFGDPETLDAILPLTGDPDKWVRVEAYHTIARFDDARVVPRLREGLDDADPYAREWAAVHLARKKDGHGIRVLLDALRRDPSRHAALVVPALETLTGRTFGKAGHPSIWSLDEQIEEACKRCDEVSAKWLAWWEDEGQDRFPAR